MRVLRPADVALKMATATAKRDGAIDAEAFDRSLSEQDHQFVGFAAKDGSILDRFGKVVGTLQPGDSFVSGPQFSLPAFMATGTFHEETWAEHTVVVMPRPDLQADSNTGVVVKSSDPSLLGAVILRPGSTGEVDCHIPSLNRIITGDPAKDWRGDAPETPPATA
jgi:hypothetical protein